MFSYVIWHWEETEGLRHREDELTGESPLTIHVNGEEIATLLCTPQDLKELAVGFLVNEGLIQDRAALISVTVQEKEGLAWVVTANNDSLMSKLHGRRYLTTGCAGGSSFYSYSDLRLTGPLEVGTSYRPQDLLQQMRQMQSLSEQYRKTGGVHGAALAGKNGIEVFREDVGRHNAVDKVTGWAFLAKKNLADQALLTTGRLSSEMLLKAARMGVPLVISRSAPTSLAVNLARELGITLIGFARGYRLNVYSAPERLLT